jgi:hypothetical protein
MCWEIEVHHAAPVGATSLLILIHILCFHIWALLCVYQSTLVFCHGVLTVIPRSGLIGAPHVEAINEQLLTWVLPEIGPRNCVHNFDKA